VKTVILAAAALAGAPAFAQAGPPAPPAPYAPPVKSDAGIYGSVGIEGIAIDEDPFFVNPGWTTLQVRAGYAFNRYISVEGQASFGLQTYAFDDDGERYDADDPDLNPSFGAFVVPHLPIGNQASLYLRAGYVSMEYEYDNGVTTTSEGPAFGVGADFKLGRSLSLYVDLTYLELSNTDEAGGLSADYDATGAAFSLGISNRF
jgi:outer membrane protein with beta-barrel domain